MVAVGFILFTVFKYLVRAPDQTYYTKLKEIKKPNKGEAKKSSKKSGSSKSKDTPKATEPTTEPKTVVEKKPEVKKPEAPKEAPAPAPKVTASPSPAAPSPSPSVRAEDKKKKVIIAEPVQSTSPAREQPAVVEKNTASNSNKKDKAQKEKKVHVWCTT